MRKLKTDDMFLLSEIADKMDIKLDVKGKTQEEVGAELILFLVKKAHKAKDEIKTLVATLTGKPLEEVSDMSPNEMINNVKEILKQDGVLDFFK
jgi:aspartate carbamoyltransferase regulatory subunit